MVRRFMMGVSLSGIATGALFAGLLLAASPSFAQAPQNLVPYSVPGQESGRGDGARLPGEARQNPNGQNPNGQNPDRQNPGGQGGSRQSTAGAENEAAMLIEQLRREREMLLGRIAQMERRQAGGGAGQAAAAPTGGPVGILPPPPREVAFQEMTETMMPLTPDQIRQFRSMLDQTQKAAAEPPGGKMVSPRSSSITVSLEAGSQMPQIQVAPHHVSALSFFDRTGEPWPIEAVTNGDPRGFAVDPLTDGGHVITVAPLATHAWSNVIVKLVGEKSPILIQISTNATTVDFRRDIRIDGLGPNARSYVASTIPTPESADPLLMAFLDRVPPPEAKLVSVRGNAASRAWKMNGKLYVRTPLTIISPAWSASVHGPGIGVYVLDEAPVILGSENGQVIELSIGG